MSMHKHENISNITTNRTNRLMNSFNIFNSPRRFQSPENLSNINKKISLINDYSPLKKYKKSNTIKNIYLKGDLIGEGRFGKVYPGLCTINAEIVTLKVYDKIAIEFGGGGHPRAAGYTMQDPYEIGKEKLSPYSRTEFCN